MSEFNYNVPPPNMNSIRRSNNYVDNITLPPSVRSTSTTADIRFLDSEIQRVSKHLMANTNQQQLANGKVTLEELKRLDTMNENERMRMLRKLSANTVAVSDAKSLFKSVSQAASDLNLKDAITTQNQLITKVDHISYEGSNFEMSCAREVIAAEKDDAIKQELSHILNLYQLMLAAPFIERIRLAVLHQQNNSPFQAERELGKAMAIPIPKEAATLVAKLRQCAHSELLSLTAENRAKENSVGAKVVANKNTTIKEELNTTAVQNNSDSFPALIRFLEKNYDYLTTHFGRSNKRGITSGAISENEAGRSKEVTNACS
jgi:hypothetical protein